MNKTLISVIVAVYNGEKFLKKCVESIICQTYKNLEIILIDDGSIDNSGKICDDFLKMDDRIKVIHKKNGGVCSARNAGIEESSGEYVCIVDQDDWLEKYYVEYLYSLIEEYNADVSIVPQVIFSNNNRYFYKESQNENIKYALNGKEVACLMLDGKIEIGPWSKMISKKMIEDKHITFNTELFGGEGYLFSIDSFMNSNRVAVGHKGIYHYRIDNYESEMSKFRMRTANSSFKAIKIMKEKYSNISKELDTSLKFAEWNVYYVFFVKMIACNEINNYKKEYLLWRKKLKREIKSLFNARVPFSLKVKGFMVVNFTHVFILFKKMKKMFIKNYSDRDYSKSK